MRCEGEIFCSEKEEYKSERERVKKPKSMNPRKCPNRTSNDSKSAQKTKLGWRIQLKKLCRRRLKFQRGEV